jgi:hypothetical protein
MYSNLDCQVSKSFPGLKAQHQLRNGVLETNANHLRKVKDILHVKKGTLNIRISQLVIYIINIKCPRLYPYQPPNQMDFSFLPYTYPDRTAFFFSIRLYNKCLR